MKLPAAAKTVEEGIRETLTYTSFPRVHWRSIRTNNPMERFMREIRRRTRVVGNFPDGRSALMLVTARLRYIAGREWGTKRYMDMNRLAGYGQLPGAGRVARDSQMKRLNSAKKLDVIGPAAETRAAGGPPPPARHTDRYGAPPPRVRRLGEEAPPAAEPPRGFWRPMEGGFVFKPESHRRFWIVRDDAAAGSQAYPLLFPVAIWPLLSTPLAFSYREYTLVF
jgi:hypothetical protein